MIISKKKYQEKLDLIEGYKRLCDKRDAEIYELEIERSNLKGLIETLEARIRTLEYDRRFS